MNVEEVKGAILKFGSQQAAARKLGITRGQLRHILGIGRGTSKVISSIPRNKIGQSTSCKSLKDFRMLYDKNVIVPRKIKEALKRLGVNGWTYEAELIHDAGISQTDMGNFRHLFLDFYVEMKSKRVWAGSAKFAQTLRGMI
jgi:hypothetical protein